MRFFNFTYQKLFSTESNASLVVFRMVFGLLMVAESFGAIATGWVSDTFVQPDFTFTFFGFGWTHFMLGEYMYLHFVLMGICAICFALGYRYRFFAIAMAIFWSLSYFMQKSHYNNHYYFMVLLSWFMAFAPANRYFSLDVKQKRVEESKETFAFYRLWFILQILILYTFAAIAKLYPSWLSGEFLSIRLAESAHWFRSEFVWFKFASLLEAKELHVLLSYGGFFYDLLIIPFVLWKPTRWIAIAASVFFHLFNSATLHIGVFPFLAIGLIIFVFPPNQIASYFFKLKHDILVEHKTFVSGLKTKLMLYFFIVYFVIQIILPVRHFFIPQPVLWTEEGHRLSWRMMLRTKSAYGNISVKLPNNSVEKILPREYLSEKQMGVLFSKPDMIWAFVQKIKKDYRNKGIQPVEIYVNAKVSINGSPYYQFTNPTIDLAAVEWNYFGHQTWIENAPKELYYKIYFF